MSTLSLSTVNYNDKKLRGIKQFWGVYKILKRTLPQEFTTKEIIKNTNDLIKTLKKKKYIDPNYEEYEIKSDYMTSDVVDFFDNHQEKYFNNEYSRMHEDYDANNEKISFLNFNKLNNLGN